MTREQYTDLLRVKMTEAEALMRRRTIENLGTPLFSGCDQLTPCVVGGIDHASGPDSSAWLAAPTEDEPNHANMADAFAYSIESFLPNKGSAIRATQRLSDNVHLSEIAHWPEPTPGVFYATPEAKIPVTDEMVAAAFKAMLECPETSGDAHLKARYRAMRRLEPRQFSPDDEDRRDLAIFLEAIYRDCCYGEAKDNPLPASAFARMADQIFEHAWYTPSVVAARNQALAIARKPSDATLVSGLSFSKAVLRLAEVKEERDSALADRDHLLAERQAMLHNREEDYANVRSLMERVIQVDIELVESKAENMRLTDLLGRLSMAEPVSVTNSEAAKPFPAGALKSSTTDPRRVGP